MTPIQILTRRTLASSHCSILRNPARFFHTHRALNCPAYNMPNEPRVDKVEALPAEEAKWIEFRKITWTDQEGKSRIWEAAARKTRGKSGVDAGKPLIHVPQLHMADTV